VYIVGISVRAKKKFGRRGRVEEERSYRRIQKIAQY
jgi:hypothetical protein